jgi:hypothetical protein
MKEAFDYAYGQTLYRYHTGPQATGYSLALKFIPKRESFVPALGKDEKAAETDALAWKAGLDKILEQLRPLVDGKVAKYLSKDPAPPRTLTEAELAISAKEAQSSLAAA